MTVTSTRTVTGEGALQFFKDHLAQAFEPGASGGVFGYQWVPVNVPGAAHQTQPQLTRLTTAADALAKLRWYTMFIIDSGNHLGDSWKVIYKPVLEVAVFIQE